MKIVLGTLFTVLVAAFGSQAQTFTEETNQFRNKYKQEFLHSENSPLKAADLPYLQFYQPDSSYRVEARFEKVKGKSFEMPTYSGMNKTYVKYGVLKFKVNGRRQKLAVYRSLSLQQLAKYKDYLFVPFKDKTNGDETYGGGRYIDLKTTDLKDGTFVLDFNKAYNPYCAYSTGYNCPIPPLSNHLTISITAGEKNFTKHQHEASIK
ncbi:hypothetical protein GCM10010967_17250 [Dyadobacter beijingensis]|uniref:DUF1684 domain-containing protein n=1 Tax=Dyadobacter beijingensis TaxID=365489 RepID=A0ABQ2HMW5_9BACT|nr:DUF1684 domain-containing protein [Dyadobacter beijingensis]GGM85661.1 hypothetical protein GCM10010967_17250 [Dyadobacter beijingensis]